MGPDYRAQKGYGSGRGVLNILQLDGSAVPAEDGVGHCPDRLLLPCPLCCALGPGSAPSAWSPPPWLRLHGQLPPPGWLLCLGCLA